jgi:myosin I
MIGPFKKHPLDSKLQFGLLSLFCFQLQLTLLASLLVYFFSWHTILSPGRLLLEQPRITKQVDKESNYNIYYQFLNRATDEELQACGLVDRNPSSYYYLGYQDPSTWNHTENCMQNAKAFKDTCDCLVKLGFSDEDRSNIFAMVAGVLHLGNIRFEHNGSGSEGCGESGSLAICGSTQSSFHNACLLLGFNQEALADALLNSKIAAGKTRI